ncbi:MAG: Wzz/FepE/Etk N-terminal domain-containing protein [Candidatus Acidiferrales bacterium]
MDKQHFHSSAYGPERLPTLRDIVTPIFRHRKLVVLTFLMLMLGTIVAVIFGSENYQSKMEILVKRERVDAAVSPGRDAALSNPGDVTEEEINSEVELLKSRDLLEKVAVSCNLQESQPSPLWSRLFPTASAHGTDEGRDNAKNISRAVSALESKLQIEPLRKTDLIQVTYDSSDPQLAARVLGTLGNLYLEKTVAVHSSPGAFEFFQTESQHYDQELHTAETHLTEFDRDKGVADPQLEKQITLQKLAEFEANFSATQVAIKETEKRTRAVEEQLASTPEQTMFQIHTSDNPYLMEQLKTTLLNLELKRTELLEKFEPDYRPVQEVQQQISQTLDAIAKAKNSPVRDETTNRNPSYDWLRSELTKSSADLASLHARATETLSVIRQYRAQLGVIDANGETQQNLQREVKEAEGDYLLYVQKREEARIADALDHQRIVNVAIAEAATVPVLPAHPHWALTLLLGTLLAGLASPGLAFAVDYFDPSLRTPDELRETLQIPVLAALPKAER